MIGLCLWKTEALKWFSHWDLNFLMKVIFLFRQRYQLRNCSETHIMCSMNAFEIELVDFKVENQYFCFFYDYFMGHCSLMILILQAIFFVEWFSSLVLIWDLLEFLIFIGKAESFTRSLEFIFPLTVIFDSLDYCFLICDSLFVTMVYFDAYPFSMNLRTNSIRLWHQSKSIRSINCLITAKLRLRLKQFASSYWNFIFRDYWVDSCRSIKLDLGRF